MAATIMILEIVNEQYNGCILTAVVDLGTRRRDSGGSNNKKLYYYF